MLEPLFKCNLACAGCGKIDYPDHILDQRLSFQQCMDAVDECDAPMVSIPGGEPLIHKEMPQIVEGIIARKKYVYLCTNALLLKKRIDDYTPSPYLTFSIHLDGLKERHDASVAWNAFVATFVTPDMRNATSEPPTGKSTPSAIRTGTNAGSDGAT